MPKTTIDELAIFGGPRAFQEALHVGKPNVGNRARFTERLDDILDRRWLTNAGRYVQEFEARLADFLGTKHCVAMCNGTVALEIAIRALGLKGEVIVPAFTFVATAHALQWQEITPVLCDVEPKTFTLDPVAAEALITPRTTGIVGVHLWGRPCDIDSLQAVADRHELTLMFDAAHAIGCTHQGRRIGGFGRAEVFSFHATKILNSFEGGAVATNDDDLAERMRLMKNFGFAGYDRVVYVGTNGKMSEVSAAMGLTSLESLDELIDANRKNYESYRSELRGIPGIRLLEYDSIEQHNYQYVTLEVDASGAKLTRDQLLAVLHAENLLARRYFYPGVHRSEPYASLFPDLDQRLPITERIARRALCLPTGTTIGEKQIARIASLIRFAITEGETVARRMSDSG